jgi:hypothetical protein
MKDVYKIVTNTFSPSVHEAKNIFDEKLGVKIVIENSKYYTKLVKKIAKFKKDTSNLNKVRPIILFFESNQHLENFENSS